MVYGGNKSNYDWFKGQNNGDKKMDRKKAAKTTWKFTKIFIYFSLFFFSMWGCVQTFIVSTSPYVGQGVEITNSRDGISPSVASIGIHKDDLTKNDNNANNAEEVYYFSPQQDNVYLSTKNDEESRILDDVEQNLKNQAGNQEFSLADANHGANIILRLIDEQHPSGTYEPGGNIVVASTDATAGVTSQATINGITTLPIYEVKFVSKDDQGVVTTDTTKVATTEVSMNQVGTLDFTKTFGTDKGPLAWHNFNIGVVNALLSNPDLNAFVQQTAPVHATLPTAPLSSNATADEKATWNKQVATYQQWIGAHNNLVYGLASAAGLDIRTNRDGQVVNDMNGDKVFDSADLALMSNWRENYMYGFGNGYSHSEYTPISTWGEAFDMSKGGGPFYGIFVYPIAWLTNALVDAMPFMQGWESFLSITIVILVMQLAAFLLSFKSTLEQAKMTEMNAKKAVIEAKYAAYKGNKQMENRKKQEIAEMYKKEGISQLGPMAGMLITMPIFLAMWRVVGSIQHFKGTEWLGINFAAQSMGEMFKGEWQYIPLIALTIGTQIFSQMYPRMLTKRRDKNRINVHQKAAMKKSNKTQNIMMIVFGVMSVMFNAGLQLYMIIRSLWKIAEVQITHHILIYKKKKAREQGGSSSTGDKFPGFKKMFKKKDKTADSSKENVKTFKKPKWMTRPKKEEVPVAKISVS